MAARLMNTGCQWKAKDMRNVVPLLYCLEITRARSPLTSKIMWQYISLKKEVLDDSVVKASISGT